MKSQRCKLCGGGPAVGEQVITQAFGDSLNCIKRSHMWSTFTGSWVDAVGGGWAWPIKTDKWDVFNILLMFKHSMHNSTPQIILDVNINVHFCKPPAGVLQHTLDYSVNTRPGELGVFLFFPQPPDMLVKEIKETEANGIYLLTVNVALRSIGSQIRFIPWSGRHLRKHELQQPGRFTWLQSPLSAAVYFFRVQSVF